MKVTTQPTLSYTEGDKLDLSRLVVTLKDNQGATRNVPFADFDKYKITAAPENGAYLTVAENNGKPVKLTKPGVRDAETGKLIVYHQSSDSGHGAGSAGSGSGTSGSGTSGSSAGHGSSSGSSSTAGGAGVGAGSSTGSAGHGAGSSSGSSGTGSAGGDANAVENALEVKRADAAVKQAANALDDALAWAKRVAADPNATKAQVDAAVRKLAEARKALAAAKANAVNVRTAVRNRVVRGMRSRGGTGIATGAGVATAGLMATMLAAIGGVFATRRVRVM